MEAILIYFSDDSFREFKYESGYWYMKMEEGDNIFNLDSDYIKLTPDSDIEIKYITLLNNHMRKLKFKILLEN